MEPGGGAVTVHDGILHLNGDSVGNRVEVSLESDTGRGGHRLHRSHEVHLRGPTSVVTNAGDDTFDARGCAFTSIFFDAGLADDAFVCEPSTNETTPDGFVGFKILSPVV